MTNEDRKKFKELFSQYCQEELNKGHCSDGDCAFCPINRAYQEIFPDVEEALESLIDFLDDTLGDSIPGMEMMRGDEQALVVRALESGVRYRISVEEYDSTNAPEATEQTTEEKTLLEAIQSELEHHEYDIQAIYSKALVCQDGNKPEFLVSIMEEES